MVQDVDDARSASLLLPVTAAAQAAASGEDTGEILITARK